MTRAGGGVPAGRRETARAIVGALTATGAGILPAFLFGGLVVQMRDDIPISTFGIGAATAVFFTVAALTSVSAGRLVERLDWARSVWVTGLLAAVPMILLATLVTEFWQLVALFCIGGLGNAVAQPAANLALVRGVRPARQGMAFGVKQAAIPAATLLAGVAVPVLALTVGWQWAYSGFAVCILMLCAVVPLGRRPPIRPSPERRVGGSVVRDSALVLMAMACAFSSMGINPTAAFLVESSVVNGIAPSTAGVLLALSGAFGVTSRLVVGYYADARPHSPLVTVRDMAVMLFLAGPGFFLLGSMGGNVWAVVLALMLATGSGYAWSGIFNLVVVRVWDATPAAATGVTQTGLWTGGVIGPLLFGFIAERSYQFAWYVCGVSMFASALCMLLAGRVLRSRGVS